MVAVFEKILENLPPGVLHYHGAFPLSRFGGTFFQKKTEKTDFRELCCESVKKRLTYMFECYIISTFLTENPIFWLKNNSNRRKMK